MSVMPLETIELIERNLPVVIFLEGKRIIVGIETVAHGVTAHTQYLGCLSDTDIPGVSVMKQLTDHLSEPVDLILQAVYLDKQL